RTGNYPLIYPNTDWIDYLWHDVTPQGQASFSVSGGSDLVKYYISAGYMKKAGIFKTFEIDFNNNPSFTKYNLRTNLDIDVTPTTRISLTSNGRIGTHVRIGDIPNEVGNIYAGAPFAG